MTELERYKRAFDLACKKLGSYSVCIWCDDEDIDCDNCRRLQATKESFLKQAEAYDEQ